MTEKTPLEMNEEMIAGLSDQDQVLAFARRDWRHWPFHFGTIPQENHGEHYSLNSQEKITTFVGTVLVPATIYLSNVVENYFRQHATLVDHVLGKEVPFPVELGLGVLMISAFTTLAYGPVSALQRLRERRLVNWWQTHRKRR